MNCPSQGRSLPAKSNTFITVVSPAFNASCFYHSWLKAIEAQGYEASEAILVDDGSDDRESARSLESLAKNAPAFLRYLRQENAGPASARNLGIGAAHGEYIAFLDLDDQWTSGHLQRLASALDCTPEAGIARGLTRTMVAGENSATFHCSQPFRFVHLGATLFRKEVFERCGLFEPSLRFGEDFDMFMRCWEKGIRKVDVPEVSLLYRRHDRNMTNPSTWHQLGALRIYQRRMKRMREQGFEPSATNKAGATFAEYVGDSTETLGEEALMAGSF